MFWIVSLEIYWNTRGKNKKNIDGYPIIGIRFAVAPDPYS